MAYREKLAWLTLACMAIAYALFFTLLLTRYDMHSVQGPPLFEWLWLFGTIAATQAVVAAVGSAILTIQARARGEYSADERDRAIARRGSNAGYFVLLTAMIVVGVLMPFSDPVWKIPNAALLGIVIAEGVRLVLIILSYRRGWHG